MTAHLPTGTDSSVAPRAGLGVTWWPAAWLERLGVGLDGRAGTNLGVSSTQFVGGFSDTTIGISARARFGGALSIEGAGGPALHISSFSGTATRTGRSTTFLRVNPALDAAVIPQLSFGNRARVGLWFGATVLLRSQRYSLDEELLLRVPTVSFDLGGRASFALD
jgi:hypothetical protein